MKKTIALLLSLCFALSLSGALSETGKGAAKGFAGDVTVELTIEDGVITAAAVTGDAETPDVGGKAITALSEAILKSNSIRVDALSGASITSAAIVSAAEAALADAGVAEADLAAVDVEKAEVVLPFAEDDIDLIVVGAGLSGLTTTARAGQLGLNVLLIEKTNATGGSSNISGGSLVGVNTHVQQAAGIEDNVDILISDFIRIGGAGTFNEELARVFGENSGAAVDWISESIGVPMNPEVQDGAYTPMSVLRVHYNEANKGKQYSDFLTAFINDHPENIYVMLDTEVTDIVLDDAGKVIGVEARTADGEEVTYTAKTTVLATGGYGGNEEVLKRYNFTNVATSSPACVSGDGYTILEKHGVAFTNMDFCTAYGGNVPISGFARTLTFSVTNGALWFDLNGSRIANEPAADSTVRSDAWTNAPENIVYMVFNDELLPADTKLFTTVDAADSKAKLEELKTLGVAFEADTVEALAAEIGLPADSVAAAVEAFNAGCEAGADEFGRTAMLNPMKNGPFYAVKTIPYVLITSGGPYVNAKLNPVTTEGKPLEGLYCVGELVGTANIGGRTSIGGAGAGSCIILGKLAAEQAAEAAGK